jgi:glutaminase
MYNGAGKFTKELGVPAKSGVSGGLLTVIPSLGAFASFSPKINAEGNTVRGIAVLSKMSDIYLNFNLFQKDL